MANYYKIGGVFLCLCKDIRIELLSILMNYCQLISKIKNIIMMNIKKIFTVILISLLFTSLIKSQECPKPNVLAWFKTDGNTWKDQGPDKLELSKFGNCDSISGKYFGDIYSVNFNPALNFVNQNGSKTKFVLKDNLSMNITIIAVLIPHDRVQGSLQWGLNLPYLGEVRQLDKDFIDIATPFLPKETLEYGNGKGTNLLIDNQIPEDEYRFGKIVTYQTILKPDRTYSNSSIINEIIRVYPDGHVPEFLVFENILDEDERNNVETYLAVKYGISKELNYSSCDNGVVWNSVEGADFKYRKAGISYSKPWDLVQSRSTSYYDDEIKTGVLSPGRLEFYGKVQDYSHHRRRLLTIGIEDESSDIKARWGEDKSSHHIWGSNNSAISIGGSAGLNTVGRIWRMETHTSNSEVVIPEIQWCNFLNLKNIDGKFSKKYEDPNLVGVAASSLGLKTCDKGSFTFTVNGFGNNSIVGFSSDNYEFVTDEGGQSGPNGDYKGYIYAVLFKSNGRVVVVRDEDGDGYYDAEAPLNSLIGKYTIKFNRSNDGKYIFSVNDGAIFKSKHVCHGHGGVFAKMHIKSNNFEVGGFAGKGFAKAKKWGTNIEFSYERIAAVFGKEYMDDPNLVPVLLIDREGANTFDSDKAEKVRGSISKTPLGYGDKVEFVDVEWDANKADLFTLGFMPKCEEETKEVKIFTDECCDIINVSFIAYSCANNEPIYYQLFDDGGDIILSGCSFTDKEEEFGDLPEGDYELKVYFTRCGEVTKAFTLKLTQSIPENLIEEEVVLLDNGEVLLEINKGFFGPYFDFFSEKIEIIWTTPSGAQIIKYPYPDDEEHAYEFIAQETGVYKVEFIMNCEDGTYCSQIDEVLVTEPCDHIVKSSTAQCCYCNYLIITIDSECSEGLVDGSTLLIYDAKSELICSTELTGMETEIPLCGITGQISYEITFIDGSIISGENILEEYLWQDVDLIEQEEGVCDTVGYGEEKCYDISDKINSLGGGWGNPIWRRIDPKPNEVIGNGEEICISETGIYIVEINKDCEDNITVCDNDEDKENNCKIIDEFCVFVKGPDCSNIDIDFNCDNDLDEPETTCMGYPFCLTGVPEGCKPDHYIIVNSYCPDKNGIFYEYNNIYYSTIPSNACPDFNTIEVYFKKGCECDTYYETFYIQKGCKPFGDPKSFVNGAYCTTDEVIVDSVYTNENDLCISWLRVQDSDTTLIQEGALGSNKLFVDTTIGNYIVNIYDCNHHETIDESNFSIIDCFMPLEDRLSVNEIICSDEDRRLELNMTEIGDLEVYMSFEVWTLYDGGKGNLLSSGEIIKDRPSYIYYLNPGDYWLSVKNILGYETGMVIHISDYHRLPKEIIYREQFEIVDEDITIDASLNVPYPAEYEWIRNAEVISNESIAHISEPGYYEVFVSTQDCSKSDTILVTASEIQERTIKENEFMKLVFQNPLSEEKPQSIYIMNAEKQDFVDIDIFSITGQLIYRKTFENVRKQSLKVKLISGVYIVRASNSSGQSIVKKLLVQ